jgi:hypothetical protein
MDGSARMQFERIAAEYAAWRAVPEQERSPAPAWWWGPAMEALDGRGAMSSVLCVGFALPPGSSYGEAAETLMKALAEQTSLSSPDEFPKKLHQPDPA